MNSRSCDVAIVGGGLAGASLAIALAQAGAQTIVIDQVPLATTLDPTFDGRASAIALGSRRMLSALGLDEDLNGKTQAINQILVSDGRVSDGAAPFFLHFDHAQIGTEPLGEMVENRHLRFALANAVKKQSALHVIAPAQCVSVSIDHAAAHLSLSTGEEIKASLCVAAEGRDSPLRQSVGIRTMGWSYDQTGIVATIAHERPHNGLAHELFLPSGPFAILPLQGNRSSIVWSERAKAAPAFLGLSAEDFAIEVGKRFGDQWGQTGLEGQRWSYPLTLQLATRYTDRRFALLGDAAHVIHPIAGQGLNLGLRDAAALSEVVIDAIRLGQDPGSEITLSRYERWRSFDNVTMAGATDILNRLFSNDWRPLRAIRGLGLAAVNELGPLRRFFMRQAGADLGDLPRLFRGEAI